MLLFLGMLYCTSLYILLFLKNIHITEHDYFQWAASNEGVKYMSSLKVELHEFSDLNWKKAWDHFSSLNLFVTYKIVSSFHASH